jgi:short-subunit dehydrogenase
VLVSNAGYGEFGPLNNFSIKQINNFITTNLTSHLIVSKYLLSHFQKIKIGDVIFIGSEASLMGAKNGSLYCTAKFGLRGLSQSLRKDVVGNNIRVCIINPGMVRTSFFDKLSFSPGDKVENSISLKDIADTTANILSMDRNTVVDEINMTPTTKVLSFK